MGPTVDKLNQQIEEFHEVEMMPPAWVKLHPRMRAELLHELGPRHDAYHARTGPPMTIMGLEMRVDASLAADFMHVGRD
ncbi:hypothetical protein [Vreelandella titanicae]|uniref:hypothetical protein n=1 Tax=Vreelandella titanicae TaxID=664683 RepID=UPI003804E613